MNRRTVLRVIGTIAIALPVATRAPAQAPAVPASIAQPVATAIAGRWHVAAADIRLVWGPAGRAAVDTSDAVPALVANAGGWFTVLLPAPGGRGTVRWSVRAGVADSVLLARHALARDATINAADVIDTVVVHWGRPVRRMRAQAGWVTRRPIAAGEELSTPAVDAPPVVAVGDSVQFVWERDHIQITLQGIALERAAALGDRITVRLPSGRTLAGLVAGPHSVQAFTK